MLNTGISPSGEWVRNLTPGSRGALQTPVLGPRHMPGPQAKSLCPRPGGRPRTLWTAASLAELGALALWMWRRQEGETESTCLGILSLTVCLDRGEVGDRQATKTAADMATPKDLCISASAFTLGRAEVPRGDIHFKPNPFSLHPLHRIIRPPGVPETVAI